METATHADVVKTRTTARAAEGPRLITPQPSLLPDPAAQRQESQAKTDGAEPNDGDDQDDRRLEHDPHEVRPHGADENR